jgi:hypothetical protein
MPIADPYQAKLREALVGAVETKLMRDRRRAVARRAVFAMAVIVALVAVFFAAALPNDRAQASIDVEARDGRIFVHLLDLESRPEEIVAAMRNAGIDVVLEEAPVGPSNVGRFVGFAGTQGGAELKVARVGGTEAFTSFSVPQDFAGVVRLSVGRKAAPGEQWRTASDATEKGEILECREIRGLTAVEASQQLAGGPASTIAWQVAGLGNLEPGAELQEYASFRVINLMSWSDGRVVVILTEHGQWPYPGDPPPIVPPSCKGK